MYNGATFTRKQAAVGGTALGASDGSGQQFVYIKALAANSAAVIIGQSTDAADGYELGIGEQLGPLPHALLTDLYVFGANTDYVCVLAISN